MSVPPTTVYVNSVWADLTEGTVVSTKYGTATIGYDAFASGDSAYLQDYASDLQELVYLSGDNFHYEFSNLSNLTLDANYCVFWNVAFSPSISIKIDASDFAGSTKRVFSTSEYFQDSNPVTVEGEGGYQYLDDGKTLVITANMVTDIFANAGWTEADTAGKFVGDTLLEWQKNAFSDLQSAVAAVSGTNTLYITGGASSDNLTLTGPANVSIEANTTSTSISSLAGNGGSLHVDYVCFSVSSVSGFSSVDIVSGGQLEVFSSLSLPEGGILNFDVTNGNSGANVMLTNVPQLPDTASVTVTTAEKPNHGTYALIGNASTFDKSISVVDKNQSLFCTLSVGGSVNSGDYNFSLSLTPSNTLTLTIAEVDNTPPTAPIASANITVPTNQDVTVTATFSEDSAQKQFSTDGANWNTYSDGVVLAANGTVSFRGIDAVGNVSDVTTVAVSNIDKEAPSAPSAEADITALTTHPVTVTVTFSDDCDQKQFSTDGTTWEDYTDGVVFTANGTVSFRGIDAAGNVSDITEFAVTNINSDPVPSDLEGDSEQASWNPTGSPQYVVEYSKDNFEHVLQYIVSSNNLDTFGLPVGTYQWRVRAIDGNQWEEGDEITAEEPASEPQLVQSDEDGNNDLFFANTYDIWQGGLRAKHGGLRNGWTGTGETAPLNGKNKITDVFRGSTDPNLLCLTDDANGDALFLDDIISKLPGSLAKQQARVAQIHEILAGGGNDVVDLTSQRFEYTGSGMTVRGGLGDDIIWSNKGNNWLFGDAGNDRIIGASNNDVIVGGEGNDAMHGGGGDDIFTFGNDWGNDTVEQLADGKVTLWFENGDLSNWNASTLTYSDGTNSVKVSGVAEANITLKFGDEGGRYSELLAAGAFNAFSSEAIFEGANKGTLA
ncbi:MAG: hypothetical protein J6866_06885 [Victivallales bacterium]|nr:hypothetical protein [Victivallales bacterium]